MNARIGGSLQRRRGLYDAGQDRIVRDHPRRSRPDELFVGPASPEIGPRRGFLADSDAEEVILDLVPDGQVRFRVSQSISEKKRRMWADESVWERCDAGPRRPWVCPRSCRTTKGCRRCPSKSTTNSSPLKATSPNRPPVHRR